jgi:hypothetical protein
MTNSDTYEEKPTMKSHRFVWVLKFLVFAAIAVTVGSAVLMSLWNWLMPSIFGLRAITFWQALGLLVFSRILFGRLGRPGRMHWRRRLHERWNQMSPEERENFLAGMKGRCGSFGSAGL